MKLGRSNGKILKRNGKLCRGCCGPGVWLADACPDPCAEGPADSVLIIDSLATCESGDGFPQIAGSTIRYNEWCYTIRDSTVPESEAPTDAPILTGDLGQCFSSCGPDGPNPCTTSAGFVTYPACSTGPNGDAPTRVAFCAESAVTGCRVVQLGPLQGCYELDETKAVFTDNIGGPQSTLDLSGQGSQGGTEYPSCCECAGATGALQSGCGTEDAGMFQCLAFPRTTCCTADNVPPGATARALITGRASVVRETWQRVRPEDEPFQANVGAGDNPACTGQQAGLIFTRRTIEYRWTTTNDYVESGGSLVDTLLATGVDSRVTTGTRTSTLFRVLEASGCVVRDEVEVETVGRTGADVTFDGGGLAAEPFPFQAPPLSLWRWPNDVEVAIVSPIPDGFCIGNNEVLTFGSANSGGECAGGFTGTVQYRTTGNCHGGNAELDWYRIDYDEPVGNPTFNAGRDGDCATSEFVSSVSIAGRVVYSNGDCLTTCPEPPAPAPITSEGFF